MHFKSLQCLLQRQYYLSSRRSIIHKSSRALGTARRPPRRFNAGTGPKEKTYNFQKRTHDKLPLWVTTTGAIVAAGAGAFYYYNLEPVPYTNRMRFICTTPEMENQMGSEAFKKSIETEASKILPKGHAASKTVARVLKRLVVALELDRKEKGLPPLDYDWDFMVIRDEMINAAALPGGKVLVFTGLFKVTPNEDALAMILAHEISHVLARHGGEKMSKGVILHFIYALLELCGFEAVGVLQLFSKFLLELPNSRACESEADEIGFELLVKACYDPEEGPKTFARMHKAIAEMTGHDDLLNDYISTHPADETRITALKGKLPEAKRRYDLGGCQQKRKAWFMEAQDYFNSS